MTQANASSKQRGLAALFTLLLMTFISLQPGYAQQSREALVVAEKVKFSRQSQRVDAVGTAQALLSVSLYPAVADRVTGVHITPGQAVSKGDVLVELDARRQRVAVQRAQIQLADTERTVQRLAASREQEAIPQSDLDDAVTLRDLRRVELDEAEANLEDRTVRAPFDGVVGITDVQVGDRINEDTMITSIDDRSQLYIDFRAPEGALDLLEMNPTLRVTPWQQSGDPLGATIAQIDSRLDITNRTIRVRALIENPEERFRPGTSFRVELSVTGESYANIPEAALMWGPTSAYVWRIVEEDGNYTAERVEAQIKQRLSGRVLIDADLEPGQLIITEGVQGVRSGQVVTFDDPDEDAV